jgi:hypothetical protein
MDNVIEFPGVETAEKAAKDPVLDFIQDLLIPWATANGIDVQSQKFKLNGATIMTCVQGMLLDGI